MTQPGCPLRVARSWRVAASHSRMIPSHPEARVLPSGLKATREPAGTPGPGTSVNAFPDATSQSLVTL